MYKQIYYTEIVKSEQRRRIGFEPGRNHFADFKGNSQLMCIDFSLLVSIPTDVTTH